MDPPLSKAQEKMLAASVGDGTSGSSVNDRMTSHLGLHVMDSGKELHSATGLRPSVS